MQPTVGDTEKEKATKSMYKRKQEENERKCKRKKHVVESLHKPGINFLFDSTVVLELGLNYL